MGKGLIIAVLISLAILAVWYGLEYQQFGTLQHNRRCDDVVFYLYLIALAIGFSKW